MDFLQAIILGIIEGVTEFLPISSTGHLILASNFLWIEQTEFVKTFEIAIQSGAILSVVFLYGRTILKDIELIKRVLIAFIPTAIIGITAYKFIKQYLIGNSGVVLLSLFLGGIVLILVELLIMRGVTRSGRADRAERGSSPASEADRRGGAPSNARSPERSERTRTSDGGAEWQDPEPKLSYERAFVIGLFQSISMIPGVSRAAATIIGGLIVGLPRKTAVEFSFLLAVPTMLAATALDFQQSNFLHLTSYQLTSLAAGFTTSFIVALISIKWLLKYVQNHNFIAFGIYRIILAIVYFLLVLHE